MMNALARHNRYESINDNSTSFAWQYTSLMIMILAFVIGAFTGKGGSSIQETKITQIINQPIKSSVITNNGFLANDIFHAGESSVNQEKYDALLSVLMNHDVLLQIDLYGEKCDPEGSLDCRNLLFKRAENLQDKFLKQNIPVGSLKIYIITKQNNAQARISYHEEMI